MILLITNLTNRSFYPTNQEQLLTFVVPFETLCAQILAQNHFNTSHKNLSILHPKWVMLLVIIKSNEHIHGSSFMDMITSFNSMK
jgi:hypothetical protein